MIEFIIHPDKFFKRKIDEDIDFRIPFLLVLACALVYSSLKIPLYYIGSGDVTRAAVLSFFSSLDIFKDWIGESIALFLLQYLYHGKGSFKRILQFIPYSFTLSYPIIFVGAILLSFFEQQLTGSTSNVIGDMITIISLILQASILRFGLKHACNMPLKNATILTGFYTFLLIARIDSVTSIILDNSGIIFVSIFLFIISIIMTLPQKEKGLEQKNTRKMILALVAIAALDILLFSQTIPLVVDFLVAGVEPIIEIIQNNVSIIYFGLLLLPISIIGFLLIRSNQQKKRKKIILVLIAITVLDTLLVIGALHLVANKL